jgi:hypothetical protein
MFMVKVPMVRREHMEVPAPLVVGADRMDLMVLAATAPTRAAVAILAVVRELLLVALL